MASAIHHLKQAKHNIAFLGGFYKEHKYNDWSITVAFYASVHIIESAIYLSTNIKYKGKPISISHSYELPSAAGQVNIGPPENISVPVRNHKFRNIIAKENFPDVSDFFMRLYRQSQNARYRKYTFLNYETDLVAKLSLESIATWANKLFDSDFKIKL